MSLSSKRFGIQSDYMNMQLQVLQKEQESEIARLEKEVMDMRAKHSEAVRNLKAKFIDEKCSFQKTSDDKLSKLTKEANLVRCALYFNIKVCSNALNNSQNIAKHFV